MKKKFLFIVIALAVLIYFLIRDDDVTLGPGFFAPDSPKQILILSPKIFEFNDYKITPLARFHIKAKVLSWT